MRRLISIVALCLPFATAVAQVREPSIVTAGSLTVSIPLPALGSYGAGGLADFKTPDRNNAVMSAIARGLTDDEAKNLAAYLSVQGIKPSAAKNKDTVELGMKIYRGGIAEKNVPACAACQPADAPLLGATCAIVAAACRAWSGGVS